MLEYIQQLNSRLVPDSEYDYRNALNLSYERAVKKLQQTNGKYTKARLNVVLKSIEKELEKLNLDFIDKFDKELPELTMFDLQASKEDYDLILESRGVPATLFAISEPAVKKMIDTNHILFSYTTKDGKIHKSVIGIGAMLQSSSQRTAKKVKGIVSAGFAIGDSPNKIADDIRRDYLTVQKRHVRTNVRTLMAEASQLAQTDFYEGVKEEGDFYKYISVLDTKTSGFCRDNDGRNWKDLPPLMYHTPTHPNCRARLTLIPKGHKPDERSVNLMTPTDKKKSKAMQKEYLKHPRNSDKRNELIEKREDFLKSKIFTVKGNMTYREAEKLYPALKESGNIRKDTYVRKLGLD